jgi:hypothetical protein
MWHIHVRRCCALRGADELKYADLRHMSCGAVSGVSTESRYHQQYVLSYDYAGNEEDVYHHHLDGEDVGGKRVYKPTNLRRFLLFHTSLLFLLRQLKTRTSSPIFCGAVRGARQLNIRWRNGMFSAALSRSRLMAMKRLR